MFSLKLFQNTFKINLAQIRTVKFLPGEHGGIQYHGFIYYPRFPHIKDPPYEPTKLLMVKRHGGMKRSTPVEREILAKFNLDGKKQWGGNITILKNIPEVNARLWKIKHRVTITPIKLVNGLPQNGDFNGTMLNFNGEFIISEKLKVSPETLAATENFLSRKQLSKEYLKTYLRGLWDKNIVLPTQI